MMAKGQVAVRPAILPKPKRFFEKLQAIRKWIPRCSGRRSTTS